jgi:hypothetical protein
MLPAHTSFCIACSWQSYVDMQVWPFKDPAYDLKKLTMERPAQAVPVLQEAAVQVGQQGICTPSVDPRLQSLAAESLSCCMAVRPMKGAQQWSRCSHLCRVQHALPP